MSVMYNDVRMDQYLDGSINSQEYKSFKIYAVAIKISMMEYHRQICLILTQSIGKMGMVNVVTCLFSFL